MTAAPERENHQRTAAFARNGQLDDLLRDLNGALADADARLPIDLDTPDRPIALIVGSGRSGTTLIYQYLAYCCGFAYPTNLIARFYAAPAVGALVHRMLTDPKYDFRGELGCPSGERAFSSDVGKTLGLDSANVFWFFWRRFFPEGATHALDADAWAAADTRGFAVELARLCYVLDAPLVMKAMILNWNIADLAALLPTAVFVDVNRDPVATVASILGARRRMYGTEARWWSFRPPEYPRLVALPTLEQVTAQLFFTRAGIERGLAHLPGHRVVRIDYDAFLDDPKAAAERVRTATGHLRYPSEDAPASFQRRAQGASGLDAADRARILRFWDALKADPEHALATQGAAA
jgi:hypothetical protein